MPYIPWPKNGICLVDKVRSPTSPPFLLALQPLLHQGESSPIFDCNKNKKTRARDPDPMKYSSTTPVISHNNENSTVTGMPPPSNLHVNTTVANGIADLYGFSLKLQEALE